MVSRFTNIKIGLLVGVGGGLPNKEDDIRLGDVVVSKPDGQYGGVVQYDLGKWTAEGFERTGSLNAPPERLLAVLNLMPRHGRRFADPPSEPYPGDDLDQLFETDGQQLAKRRPGSRKDGPHVFYGTIASGNSIIKDAAVRDKLISQHGVLCCEMEAAGLMNTSFPCLVIRGISDYADAHKNDVWHDYAAATSARYAKDFLSRIPDELERNLPSVIPLHLGVVLGKEYVAGQLREMKGNLDMKDERGRTALHWAVIWRDEAVVQLLVDEEANIDLRDNNGRTALWYAVTTRNEAVERILLDKGACLEVKDDDIDTVMRYATELCDFYLRQDKLERGEEILRQALRAYEKNIQPDKPIDIGHQATLTRINGLADLYNERGKFRKAEELYQLQIDGCKKAFGLDDERTLWRIRDLGAFYLCQDKPDEAEGMLLQALQGYEKNIQPAKPIDSGHEVTLIHIDSLAKLYNQRGKFRKAEELYQLQIDGCKKALVPDDKRTLSRILDLGAFYLSQDKPDEAEGMLRQALQGYEGNIQPAKPIDSGHEVTLIHINSLAKLYNQRGKFRKAEELYQLQIDGCKKALGPDDERTLWRIRDLGAFYLSQDKPDEAEGMLLQALQGYEGNIQPDKSIDSSHEVTLIHINDLADLYNERGKFRKAEELYQLQIDGCKKALGPDDKRTLSRILDLGAFYLSQDKPDEAEGMLLQALQGYEGNIQPDKPIDIGHQATLTRINDLADLYNERGKFRKAEELYQLQIDGCKKALGPHNRETLRRMRDLGYFCLHQDKPDEAEGMLLQALQGYEKNIQPDKPIDSGHEVTLTRINDLADLYNERGKFRKAEQLYQLQIDGCKKAFGLDDERTLWMIRDLGAFYLCQDKPDEAEGMLLQALQGYEKNFQPDKPIDIGHQATLTRINDLADLYKERGKFEKAKELYQLEINGCKQALGPNDERTLSRTRDLRNLKKELKKLKASQAAIAPMGGDGNAIAPQAAPTSHSLVAQNPGTAEASRSGSRRGDHDSKRRHERRKRSRKKKSDTRGSRNDNTQVGTPLKPAGQREETDGGVGPRTKHKEGHDQPEGQHVHREQYRKGTGRLNLAKRLLAQSRVSLGF
jgi:tetratricopeptide (TPR) repeat protein/nucleoside phosphorylase